MTSDNGVTPKHCKGCAYLQGNVLGKVCWHPSLYNGDALAPWCKDTVGRCKLLGLKNGKIANSLKVNGN